MNRRVLWIIELFLWVIVTAFISFLFVFIHSVKEQKTNSYYLFFSDVDGLMKGSPVRLMGMQIGYVQNIKVFDNKVFVSFLVTSKNVTIPEQAIATVEFYGLGGSKSLEITPAVYSPYRKTKKDDLIITREPYRIQDFYDVQNSIARTIVRINNSFTAILEDNEIYKAKKQLKVSNKIQKLNGDIKEVHEKEMNLMRRESSDILSEKLSIKKLNDNKEVNNAPAAH